MKIAAFNVQKFGKKKLSDPAIIKTLIEVCDINIQYHVLSMSILKRTSEKLLFPNITQPV